MPEYQRARCYSYIRFSTPDQLKGDSLRRQLKLSENYAKKHGLELDSSLRDLGKSGYKAEHIKDGALGKFLVLVRDGEVPEGSVLLVESLDRLSRQHPFDAFMILKEIIQAGIKIVTLSTGNSMEYSRESIEKNPMQMMIWFGEQIRAHEESRLKGERLREAWQNKRENITIKPLTGRTPAWLKLDKKSMEIKPIETRCDLVRKMFQMSARGIGIGSIARRLNKRSIPSFTGRNWQDSSISKILHSKAVYGEFQPSILGEGRKRIQVGEPVPDYYPPIISKELFYEVQERLKARRTTGGRTGKISNLFTHLAKCAYCGGSGSMVYVNKGKRGQAHLVCDDARRQIQGKKGPRCRYVSFPYPEFEKAFLQLSSELRVDDVIDSSDKKTDAIKAARSEISSLTGDLADATAKTENFEYLMGKKGLTPEQLDRYSIIHGETTQRQVQLKKALAKAKSNLSRLERQGQTQKRHLKSIKELFALMDKTEGEELVELRFRLRQAIRELVKVIYVFPDGMRDQVLTFENLKPEYLFENPFTKNKFTYIDRSWRHARDNAKIEDFHFHDLRHTFATYTLLKTGNVRLVQELLGHSKLETTQKYAHILAAQQADTINDLGDIFMGQGGEEVLKDKKRKAILRKAVRKPETS